ncbi:hypothetical protein GGR54DRAFT_445943 [Hypoxylon sp. NC1633]|nr:hypothetical protein GGR54DRAFT_445943 [Hypoxylon sp. NC1633]
MLKSTLALLGLVLSTALALPSGPTRALLARNDPLQLSPRDLPGCATTAQGTGGDPDTGGRGIQLYNADNHKRSFFVYENNCDAVPLKYITLDPGQAAFVSLPAMFQGRIVRGTKKINLDGKAHWLGTWLEIGLDATGRGYADVSLIRGCDGAVTITAEDGTGVSTGFSDPTIIDDAPGSVLGFKDSGSQVLQATEGLLSIVFSPVRDYLASRIGYGNAYIDDYHGNPVICSANERFSATFYRGRP